MAPPTKPPVDMNPHAAIPAEGIPVGHPVNQPAFDVQMQYSTLPRWSTGLCDCCEDVGNCCITCWFPCITFGQIADIVDRGAPSCGASGVLYTLILLLTSGYGQCLYSCAYRSKLRALYSLPESPCPDCIVHCCCETCALCQEYRELKNQGFDMAIGWHANMQKQQGQMPPGMQPPVMQGGMYR